MILKGGVKVKSRITTLAFRRADLGLFRELLGRFPLDMALRGKKALGELVTFQGSPPLSTGMVHPDKQETKQKWLKAFMGEHVAPGKTPP